MISRRAIAAPIQCESTLYLRNKFQPEHTKRVPDSCHLSCAMLSNSGLNSWEDLRRRPWNSFSVKKKTEWMKHLTYLACSFAKPLWALIEELTPGKRATSNDSKNTSESVKSASLYTCSAFYWSCEKIKPTCEKDRFLDERRRPLLEMARSQHTLQHKWHNFIIQGDQNSKSNAYRTAQNYRRLLMLLGWSLSSPRNLLLFELTRRLMTHPKERRTLTGPVNCRTCVTIRCAGEEREGFERRDLRRTERSDSWRCSVDNRGQQRD